MPRGECWTRLGIDERASAAEVRAAYRRRVRALHPDHGGAGDGLALRQLEDARAEALKALEQRSAERAASWEVPAVPLADRVVLALALLALGAITAAAWPG